MQTNNIFNNLLNDFNNNKNSHSYIIYTNDFIKCNNDFNEMLKMLYDVDNINEVQNDIYKLETSNKNIQKEEVLELMNFFKTKSLNNKIRIFVIEEAQKLNLSSSNVLLKFLEEPNDNIAGFLITNNLDSILPTIKSRCQILHLYYEINDDIDYNKVEVIKSFLKLNNEEKLWKAKKCFEKYERIEIIDLFNNYLKYLLNDYIHNLKMIEITNEVITKLNNNVNIDYALDYLVLRGSEV